MSTETPAAVADQQIELMPEETVELDSMHATANLQLVKVEVTSTEVDEDEVFSERSALYRFSDEDNDWKERARGDIKVFQHKTTKKYRLVMRAEKTLKVRLNQYIGDVSLQPNSGSDKAWNWRWQDYATDSGLPEVHSFAIRFRTKEIADAFNALWEKARQVNKDAGVTEGSSIKKEEDGVAEEKKEEEKKEEEKKVEEAPKTE